MPLTSLGAAMLADGIIGGSSYTKLNNGNAYIGVGNGTTAFSAGQTDLQGASKTRIAMDATYPSRSSGTVTYRSTFGSGDGNHAWEEWGLFNHPSAGQMFSRKVESLGTKVSGATWEFTVTHSYS